MTTKTAKKRPRRAGPRHKPWRAPALDPQSMAALGAEIRRIRTAAEMSQPMLAAKAGVSRSAISQYELGTHPPALSVLCAVCRALDVSVATVVGAIDRHDAAERGGGRDVKEDAEITDAVIADSLSAVAHAIEARLIPSPGSAMCRLVEDARWAAHAIGCGYGYVFSRPGIEFAPRGEPPTPERPPAASC